MGGVKCYCFQINIDSTIIQTMIFNQRQEYRSIKQLSSPAYLPDFLLLTGSNGSGKTHILEAIKNGSIAVLIDERQLSPDDIIMVNFGELSVSGADHYSSQDAVNACTNTHQRFNKWRRNFRAEMPRVARDDEHEAFLGFIERYRNANDVENERALDAVKHTVSSEPHVGIDDLNKQHLWKHIFDPATSTVDVNFFEQNFARLFAEYQVSLIKQRFYKYLGENGYDEVPSIDDSTLRQLEQNKPWDFVNEVLETAGFNFRMLPPDFWDVEEFDYNIKLKKNDTGDEVLFSELSTGEKVLFALALVRYKAERRSRRFPELILLDEPDAPLHPQMTQGLIDVINSVFVEQYQTKVVMTTHAPATVALAPKPSVHAVTTEAEPVRKTVIAQKPKQDALNMLTSGFVAISGEEVQAKLSIEVKEARSKPIIFVEGQNDLSTIRIAWRKVTGERALPFKVIETGDATQMRLKIDAVHIDELNESNVLAIFDFDSAYNQFSGLKTGVGFSEIQGDEQSGLYRTRQNDANKVTHTVLPVPPHRIGYASSALGDKSILELELLFDNTTLSRHNNLATTPTVGGGSMQTFQGNKTTFADRVTTFDRAEFNGFEPLVDAIRNHLSL